MTALHPNASNPARRRVSRTAWLLTTLGLTLLTGCASVYRVDSQVQSFARWNDATQPAAAASSTIPQAPQLYRFERLPSQSAAQAARGQDELEALTRAALAQRGWTLAEPGVSARWSVQVNAGTLKLPRAPWEEPWNGFGHGGAFGGGFGGGFGALGGFGFPGRHDVVTGSGQVIWAPVFMRMDLPYYERKVSLLIRNAGNGQVVYETHAAHDGRWNSSPELWGAMLDAALQGFPAPASERRQVNIDLPR